MVVVRAGRAEPDVGEVGVDPGDAREPAGRGVLHERRRQRRQAPVEEREPRQVLRLDRGRPVVGVGCADRRDVVEVPLPRHLRVVEVADERRQVVDRRVGEVLPVSERAAGERVEAVRPRVAGERREPAVADQERLREVVVDGERVGVVVADDDLRVGDVRVLLREVLDEAARVALQLLVDAVGRVARVVGLVERRPLELVHRVRLAGVLVLHPGLQAVDVVAPALEAQVAEHVVEGAVLEHEHDEVLDLREVLEVGGVVRAARPCAHPRHPRESRGHERGVQAEPPG